MEPRSTARGWYLVGAGLVATAITMAVTGYTQMRDTVRTMQRVVVPGTSEIALAPGRTMIYAETRSTVSGLEYTLDAPVAVSCKLHQEGKQLELRAPRAAVSYDAAGFAGNKVFDVDVPAAGTYTLACTSEKQLALAVGGGIGAWLVVALVGGLVPGLAGLAVLIVVFLKRRRAA